MSSFSQYIKKSSPAQWTTWILASYFLVFLHYFQGNQGGSGLNHPMNPLGWIALSMIIACGLIQISRSGQFRFNQLSKWLGIASLMLLLPLFYSGDTAWYSHQRLLGLFAGLAFLIAIQQMRYKQSDYFSLFHLVVIGIFIESIISMAQFYLLPYFTELNIKFDRPTGLFFQANVAATFFATGLLLALTLLQRHQSRSRASTYLYYIATLSLTLCLCLLQSRTGFIAALLGSVLLLCYRSPVNKRWLVFVACGVIAAVASLSLLERTVRDNEIYSSPGLRTQIYQDSIELIAAKPLLGHGYGSFAKVYSALQATKLSANNSDSYHPAYQMRHPHNEILLWVIEGGIIAFVAMLIILGTACWVIWRNRRQKLLALALLFPFALHSLTEFPFYQSVAAWMLYLLLLSFLVRQTKSLALITSKTAVYSVSALLLVMLTTIYMSSVMVSQSRSNTALLTQNNAIFLNSQLPFISEQFEERLNKEKLIIAMRRGLDSEVSRYYEWAAIKNSVDPRPNRFKNSLLCLLYFKQITPAQQELHRASLLFPTLDWQLQQQWINDRKKQIKHTN